MTGDPVPAAAIGLESVIAQHALEAASILERRTALVGAPHLAPALLAREDQRLVAHLDGVEVAGELGWEVCRSLLGSESGMAFVAGVVAIRGRHAARLQDLFDAAGNGGSMESCLFMAFGWVSSESLKGTAQQLLLSSDPLRQRAGLAACAMHRADPGDALSAAMDNAKTCTDALRAAGEIGRRDLVGKCTGAIAGDDEARRVWGAWSAVLLGDRNRGLSALTDAAMTDGPHRGRALRLALQASGAPAAHGVLKHLASDQQQQRWLIQGSGVAGDPAYVPWLVDHMRDDKVARLAGESFGLITGLDLSWHEFERPRPENFESGPNDNPDDENVEMDPDEGLPWPDPEKIEKWWAANAARFQKGVRYFMGAPVTREHCINVLKNGYQRQRILAAHYLCLLEPGTPLFNTSAPAWRQQRLLARM